MRKNMISHAQEYDLKNYKVTKSFHIVLNVSKVFWFLYRAIMNRFQLIFNQCYASLSPENIRKAEVLFSEGIEVETCLKMG